MDDALSLLESLDEWSKATEVKPGETGRIIATILVIIVISYVLLFMARIVKALTLPALVIMGLLVIYRCVSITEVVEALMQLPDVLCSLKNFIAGFIRKAN
ncbi:hypothetical protein KR059_005398, partial [Drosophila kikkawai]